MNIEERFCLYQNTKQNELRAEAVEAAVRTSKEAFYASEQENMLSYHEFLWMQLKFIQKRWWLFQMGLLTVLWVMLSVTGEAAEIKKGLGVTASLFVILMIPEIWKNRSSHSTEIEAASFYSLKQIYAARMTLFALVDVILLSIFCGISTATARIAFTELIVQFLLPMSISACICFQVLCSKTEFKRSNGNCAVSVLECSLDTDSAKRNHIQSHHTTGLVSSAGRFRHLFIHYGTSGFEQL